jgi:hypothetical protein
MDNMDTHASYHQAASCNGQQKNDLDHLRQTLAAMNTKLAAANTCLEAAFDIKGWSASDPAHGLQQIANAAVFISFLRHRLQELATFYDSPTKTAQQHEITALQDLVQRSYQQNARWAFDAQLAVEPRWAR